MGAWGYGILQNDTAQDSMCGVANRIEADIASLPADGSEQDAAKAGAATALLLQFSLYSFNPENSFYEQFIRALTANRDHFDKLPGNAADVLTAIIEGRGSELAARDGEVDANTDKALHSDENDGFIMQKAFAVIEHDLFQHPIAKAYLQHTIDQLVAEVDEGFADEWAVSDLSREAEFMGSLGLLLILPTAHVDAGKFKQWRDRFREVWATVEEDDDEKDFTDLYNANLELAFKCGEARFSK